MEAGALRLMYGRRGLWARSSAGGASLGPAETLD